VSSVFKKTLQPANWHKPVRHFHLSLQLSYSSRNPSIHVIRVPKKMPRQSEALVSRQAGKMG
jgi:hypothetical protein